MKLSLFTTLSVASSAMAATYSLKYAALINPIKDAISNGVVNGRLPEIPMTQAQAEVDQFVPLIMDDELLPLFDDAVSIVLSPDFADKFPGWISDVIAALDAYELSPDFTSATNLLSKVRTHYDYHECVKQASITMLRDAPGWGILRGAVLGISSLPEPSKAIDDALYAVTGLICTLQLTDGSVCDPYKTNEPDVPVIVPATTGEPVASATEAVKSDVTEASSVVSEASEASASSVAPATVVSEASVASVASSEAPAASSIAASSSAASASSAIPEASSAASSAASSVASSAASSIAASSVASVPAAEPSNDSSSSSSSSSSSNSSADVDINININGGFSGPADVPIPVPFPIPIVPIVPNVSNNTLPSAVFNNATATGTALVTSSLTLTVTQCDQAGCITPVVEVTTVVPRSASYTVIKTVCPKCEGKTITITVPCPPEPTEQPTQKPEPTEHPEPIVKPETKPSPAPAKSEPAPKPEKPTEAPAKSEKPTEAPVKSEKPENPSPAPVAPSVAPSVAPAPANSPANSPAPVAPSAPSVASVSVVPSVAPSVAPIAPSVAPKPVNSPSPQPKSAQPAPPVQPPHSPQPATPSESPKAVAPKQAPEAEKTPLQASTGSKWTVSMAALLAGVVFCLL